MTTDKDQSIWKWENTAHITKMSIEGLVAVASLAGAITAILIATKVIAGPASLALVASPAGIAVLFIAAVYFAAAAYASYQQMNAMEGAKGKDGVKGKDGANGKDADFAALVGDVIKKGEIVEENQQLSLKLSKSDYDPLVSSNMAEDAEITLKILLAANKETEVKFKHVANANDGGNYKVQLTSVGDKDQLADMKRALDMTVDSELLKVAVSNKDMGALKADVTTNLVNVAVEKAISKVKDGVVSQAA